MKDFTPYVRTRRDRVAVPIINLVARLASRQYRATVKGSIEYGMRAAARDHAEGRPYPPDWRNPS